MITAIIETAFPENITIGNDVRIMDGSFVAEGTRIGARSLLGAAVVTSGDMHPNLADYHANAGAAGPDIGEECLIGSGANLLAGVRIGYMVGPAALIAEIDKVRPPYNISALNCECSLFALEHLDVFAAQAAGYDDVIAAPSFAVVIQERSLATVLADKEADIDFSRVVHGDQRFIHARPIVAGDELTSQLTVASVKSLGAHSMVTFETKIHDSHKHLVCTAISTLVVRGAE